MSLKIVVFGFCSPKFSPATVSRLIKYFLVGSFFRRKVAADLSADTLKNNGWTSNGDSLDNSAIKMFGRGGSGIRREKLIMNDAETSRVSRAGVSANWPQYFTVSTVSRDAVERVYVWLPRGKKGNIKF